MIIIYFLCIFPLCFISYEYTEEVYDNYFTVIFSLIILWISDIGLEIYHIVKIRDQKSYMIERIVSLIVFKVFEIIATSIFVAIYYKYKELNKKKLELYIYTFIITIISISLIRQTIPQLFFASIYTVEIIAANGIVALNIVTSFILAFMIEKLYNDQNDDEPQERNSECTCCHVTFYYIVNMLIYLLILIIMYFIIIAYTTLLYSLKKSPNSQVVPTILAIIPPTLVAVFSFALKKLEEYFEN